MPNAWMPSPFTLELILARSPTCSGRPNLLRPQGFLASVTVGKVTHHNLHAGSRLFLRAHVAEISMRLCRSCTRMMLLLGTVISKKLGSNPAATGRIALRRPHQGGS